MAVRSSRAMKTIRFEDPHRRKHFDFFSKMDQPHFSITANVDVTELRRNRDLKLTPAIVYVLSRAANEIAELRRRIRGAEVVEHDVVHPSFAVRTDVSDVFSFCEVPYRPSMSEFIADAMVRMEERRTTPSLEDEPGRDDYLFMSAIPWIAFTAITHAMHYHPTDSVPRIAWGKVFAANERALMPLSIQAHHALVDGIHLGRFFERTQELFDSLPDPRARLG
jgi:chloramphenicol O-acetyltransferase type A